MAVNVSKIKEYGLAALAQISTVVSVIPFSAGLAVGVIIGFIRG